MSNNNNNSVCIHQDQLLLCEWNECSVVTNKSSHTNHTLSAVTNMSSKNAWHTVDIPLPTGLHKRMTNFWIAVTNMSSLANHKLSKLPHKHYFTSASQIFGNAVTKANWYLWEMFVVFSKALIPTWFKTIKQNKMNCT